MALVDVEGVFYATVLVGGTRQATAATKWASIPACSGIACQYEARNVSPNNGASIPIDSVVGKADEAAVLPFESPSSSLLGSLTFAARSLTPLSGPLVPTERTRRGHTRFCLIVGHATSSTMDPDTFRAITLAMRLVRGKKDAVPAYYYELCDCYAAKMSHPPHGITGRDLVAAAENGCLTCSIVKGALTTALGEPVKEEHNIVYKLKSGYGIKIRYMLKDEWSTQCKFQVFLSEGWSRLIYSPPSCANLQPIEGEPTLPPPLRLEPVQEILEECNLHHSRCSVTELPTLPTRVVAVGNANTSPKLLCTQGERAEYLALSHCWGTEQNFTTTTATLSERTRGIAWADLPKSFQDAITLARTLGFSYVWIDSLCILQDDR